jgi:copper(I)-binding protein
MKHFIHKLGAAALISTLSATPSISSDDNHAHHQHTKAMQMIKVGDLEIMAPIIRATPPNAKVAAGYMTIKNKGSETDRLTGGTATFAEVVEVHEMKMDGEIMRMREIEGGLEIPAGGEVVLKTGGLHIMFMKLKEQMKEGDTHKVTYQFENAGSVELELPVKHVVRNGHNQSN